MQLRLSDSLRGFLSIEIVLSLKSDLKYYPIVGIGNQN